MEAFKTQLKECFQIDCNCKFTNMAFDGCSFYFLECNSSKIYQYDLNFRFITSYCTSRCYSFLCYDWKDNCFWAIGHPFRKTIYRLNPNFMEIGSLPIKSKEASANKIVGISYDLMSNRLNLAIQNCVIEIDKACFDYDRKMVLSPSSFFFSLQPYKAGFATGKIEQNRQYLTFYSNSGLNQFQSLIDEDYNIEDGVIGVWGYQEHRNDSLYLLLSKKDATQCVMKLKMDFFEKGSLINFCELSYDNRCACDEMLRSYALVEASIARILNLEAEKMERTLEICLDPQVLIALNQSVNHTILNLTHLEQVLGIKRAGLTNSQ